MHTNNITCYLFNTTLILDNIKLKDPQVQKCSVGTVILIGQGLSIQASEGGMALMGKEQPHSVPSLNRHGCPAYIKQRSIVSTAAPPRFPTNKQTNKHQTKANEVQDGGNQRWTLLSQTEKRINLTSDSVVLPFGLASSDLPVALHSCPRKLL